MNSRKWSYSHILGNPLKSLQVKISSFKSSMIVYKRKKRSIFMASTVYWHGITGKDRCNQLSEADHWELLWKRSTYAMQNTNVYDITSKYNKMLHPHIPRGKRTFSSLRATCAWSGRLLVSRERLELLCPGWVVNCLQPASLSAVLEEPDSLISQLSGFTRLAARDEDRWEGDEEEVEESFCNDMQRIWLEFCDTLRGELHYCNREREQNPNQHYNDMLKLE